MSFTAGTGAFGNYDRSAQTGGIPFLHRTTSHDVSEEQHATASHGPSSPSHRRPSKASLRSRPSQAAMSKDEGALHEAPAPSNHTTTTLADDEKAPVSRDIETPIKTLSGREESDETSSDDEDAIEEARRASLVHDLARSYSNASAIHGGNAFASTEPDSPLNPNGEKFSARVWAKTLLEQVHNSGQAVRTSGIAFQNLNVFGFGAGTDFQKDVANILLDLVEAGRNLVGTSKKTKIDILRNFDGLVNAGEMLVVLGPPGSGCSTMLKTISGEMNGIYTEDSSYFNYQGVDAKEMHSHHRGEAIYTAEVDVHFPMLTVGDTLTFAAKARCPRELPSGISKDVFTNHVRDVVMAMFGISHTVNTRVGNEYVRGVSGGERKRVTISEASLSGAPLQCWDNSTRGLDSANAIEFCKTLRLQSDLFGSTACVSIYQAPQSAYDLFDKAAVLYEGRQIYFGRAEDAKQYFVDLGFECPARQTTPDFLTSMTSPSERIVRAGFEGRAPRTPDEFATAWKNSTHYARLQVEIEQYKKDHPLGGEDAAQFRAQRRAIQSKSNRPKSPYTLDYTQQVQLCLWRGWRRLTGDPSLTIGALVGNTIMALVISSVFYNLQMTTGSFFQRGALLFFACLMNGFASALEVHHTTRVFYFLVTYS